MNSVGSPPQAGQGENAPYLKAGIGSLLVNMALMQVKLVLASFTGGLALRAGVKCRGRIWTKSLVDAFLVANQQSSYRNIPSV